MTSVRTLWMIPSLMDFPVWKCFRRLKCAIKYATDLCRYDTILFCLVNSVICKLCSDYLVATICVQQEWKIAINVRHKYVIYISHTCAFIRVINRVT